MTERNKHITEFIVALLVIVGIIVVLVSFWGSRDERVDYGDLSPEERVAVLDRLQERGGSDETPEERSEILRTLKGDKNDISSEERANILKQLKQ